MRRKIKPVKGWAVIKGSEKPRIALDCIFDRGAWGLTNLAPLSYAIPVIIVPNDGTYKLVRTKKKGKAKP